MILTCHLLQQKITLLEPFFENRAAAFAVNTVYGLLLYVDEIEALEKVTAVSVTLPYYSVNPACEIETGYITGVNDYREAIRQAGYPIGGDD